MQVRRLPLLILALVGCLAVVSVSAMAAHKHNTKRFTAQATLSFQPAGDPYLGQYSKAHFTGKVVTNKGVCRKRRRISIRDVATDKIVGKGKSDKQGDYSTGAGSAAVPDPYSETRSYKARVEQKIIKRHRHKIVCKKGRSKKISITS